MTLTDSLQRKFPKRGGSKQARDVLEEVKGFRQWWAQKWTTQSDKPICWKLKPRSGISADHKVLALRDDELLRKELDVGHSLCGALSRAIYKEKSSVTPLARRVVQSDT